MHAVDSARDELDAGRSAPHGSAAPMPQADAIAAAVTVAGNRVLLVEDEALVAMVMRDMLTELGFAWSARSAGSPTRMTRCATTRRRRRGPRRQSRRRADLSAGRRACGRAASRSCSSPATAPRRSSRVRQRPGPAEADRAADAGRRIRHRARPQVAAGAAPPPRGGRRRCRIAPHRRGAERTGRLRLLFPAVPHHRSLRVGRHVSRDRRADQHGRVQGPLAPGVAHR